MVMCVGCNVIDTDKKKMVLIHTVEDMKQSDRSVGQSVELVFVRADYCNDMLGIPFASVNPKDYAGKELFLTRGRTGYVNRIEICE